MTSSKQIDTDSGLRRLGIATIVSLVSVYCLIVIGGVVRSTGSGMGCPDWPKCFGSWVPPTDASQLPANYQEIYGKKLKGEVVFNVTKTWTEYLNRLFGVLTGIVISINFFFAIPRWRKGDRRSFYLALLGFLLVALQGWIGSKVVATELHPIMVTVHMLLAIVLVFVLLALYMHIFKAESNTSSDAPNVYSSGLVGWMAIGLSLVQVVIGTQVREAIDVIASKLGEQARSEWISGLGWEYYFHRSFSLALLLVNFFFVRKLKASGNSSLAQIANWIVYVLIGEVIVGVVLAYGSIPPFLQPVHLTLAIILLGVQFLALGRMRAFDSVFKARKVYLNPNN